jgi:nitroreductase/NAD-dependent dihydropyrimidine dehydrogenase PreA subunit
MLMQQVIINRQDCTGCGICMEICPYQAIVLEDGAAVHSGGACFLCGHCQAACLQEAIVIPGLLPTLGLTTIAEKSEVTPPGTGKTAELVALMRSRRSSRKYQDKSVPLEVLTDLVKIGTTAPSGTNSQGWNFIILPTRDDVLALGGLVSTFYRGLNKMAKSPLLRGLVKVFGGDSLGRYYRNYYASVTEALREWDEEGTDRLFHGAAAAILVTGRKDASCPAEDALLATQNILLAAHAMGLGSCLIGFAVEALRRTKTMRRQVEIPADEEIYSVIALGYPAVAYQHPAGRKAIEPRVLHLTRAR